MEKYMFVFMGDDGTGMSPAEQEASMQKWFAWVDRLTKAGRYIAGEALLPGTGKTITGTKKTVTDGPFAEGKEIVGGFFLVYAKDLEEATEMAKDFPDFETGGIVEVREVMKLDM